MSAELDDRDAVLSLCHRYRYSLTRTWRKDLPRAAIVMLNPSTADALVDDPTIRSCVRLCRRRGFGSFEVVNLFAFRATNPRDLRGVDDPFGPDNDAAIDSAIRHADKVIVAWGSNPMVRQRGGLLLAVIRRAKGDAYCFGYTHGRFPRHPLYVPTETPLEVYEQAPAMATYRR